MKTDEEIKIQLIAKAFAIQMKREVSLKLSYSLQFLEKSSELKKYIHCQDWKSSGESFGENHV